MCLRQLYNRIYNYFYPNIHYENFGGLLDGSSTMLPVPELEFTDVEMAEHSDEHKVFISP